MSSGIALADSAMQGIAARRRGRRAAGAAPRSRRSRAAAGRSRTRSGRSACGPRDAGRAGRLRGDREAADAAHQLLDEQHVDLVVLDVEDLPGALAARARAVATARLGAAAGASTAGRPARAASVTSNTRAVRRACWRRRSLPPMPSTSALTMVRPMPVPSMPSLSAPKRLNGSNRLASCSALQAAAGVAHASARTSPRRHGACDDHAAAAAGCT